MIYNTNSHIKHGLRINLEYFDSINTDDVLSSRDQVIMDPQEDGYYGKEKHLDEEREPYFDTSQTNLTSVVGSVARLNCSVQNLGIKTVRRMWRIIDLAEQTDNSVNTRGGGFLAKMYLSNWLKP